MTVRRKRVQVLLVLVAMVLLAAGVHKVRAGSGTMAPTFVNNAFTEAVMTSKVFIDAPRSEEKRKAFERQLSVANRLMCDYTDGKFRFSKFEIVTHPAQKKNADIWWFDFYDRASSDLGAFGHGVDPAGKCDMQTTMRTDLGRLNIYSFDRDGDGVFETPEGGATIAHELGHLVFGMGDQYENQRGLDNGTPWAAGISGVQQVTEPQSGESLFRPFVPFRFAKPDDGTQFFAVDLAYKDLVRYTPVPVDKSNNPLYESGPGLPWWLQNNTIMQQAEGQVCAKVDTNLGLDGQSARLENPALFTSKRCWDDMDCPSGYLCYRGQSATPKPDFTPVAAPISSELTVSTNYDLDRFNLTAGDPRTPGSGAGHIQPARHLVIQGALWPSAESVPGPSNGFVSKDDPCPDRGPPPMGGGRGPCTCPVDFSEEGTFGKAGQSDLFPGGEIFAVSTFFGSSAKCPYEDLPGVPPPPVGMHASSFACLRTDTSACPARLGTTRPAGGGPFCGDGVVTIDGATNVFEQCDNGNGGNNSVNPDIPLDNGGKPLTCAELWSERIARLHNGTHFPIPPSLLVGGNVHCSKNCNYDLSRCGVQLIDEPDPGKDGSLSLRELREQSQGWAAAEVFDSLGQVCAESDRDGKCRTPELQLAATPVFPEGSGVNLSEIGPSNHVLFSSLRRLGRYAANGFNAMNPDWRDLWELQLAVDAAEFGGTSGAARVVRSFALEFAVNLDPGCTAGCGPLVKVNGVDFHPTDDETTWPRVFLGFDTPKDDPPFGTQGATGPFTRGVSPPAPGFELRVDLRNLIVQRLKDADGNLLGNKSNFDINTGVIGSYARNGLKRIPAGTGPFVEIPQYGDINWRTSFPARAQFYDLFGFNTETQRYESSSGTLDLLFRANFGDDKPSPGYDPIAPVADLKNKANDFIDSDWERLDKVICRKWGFHPGIPGTALQIDHVPPVVADCPDPEVDWSADGKPIDFNEDTQVVFVLDRSGSMGAKADSDENPGSRLDYVKNAGHVFAETMIANMRAKGAKFGPKIGLVYYSTEPTIKIGVGDPATTCTDQDVSQCTDRSKYPGSCLHGHCKTYLPVLSETEGVGKVTVTDLKVAHMVIGQPGIAPVPTAHGFTASGLGLQEAIKLFDPKTATGNEPTRIIVFLTDGQHNRPAGGKCLKDGMPYHDDPDCWPGEKAEAAFQKALEDIAKKKILIYDVPLANEVDPATGSIRSGVNNGEVFQASSPLAEDAIPAFFAATAASFGEQVVRSHNSLPSELTPATEYEDPMVTYFVDVEPGAQALKLVISDYDSSRDPFDLTTVEVIPPSGPSRFFDTAHPTPEQPIDPLSGAMFIANPEPGRWRIRHPAPDERPLFFVSAHVEDPLPNCYARVNNPTVKQGETAMITAQAVFEKPVVKGATISGKLLRADKILVNLSFTPDDRIPSLYKALVAPEDLVGRGQYIATVRCDVEQDAELAAGEALPSQSDLPTPATRKAQKFHRETDVTFFLDSAAIVVPGINGNNQPPEGIDGLPPGFAPVDRHVGDADKDGIPNSQEPPPTVDTDGDGTPDINDPDANGNTVPDKDDPGICKTGACLIAEAGPSLFLECVADAATGTLDGGASKSSNGGPLTFAWSAPVPLMNPNTAVATGTFPNAATTTASLTVSDGTGSAADTTDVTVMDLTPPTQGPVSDVTVGSCTVPDLPTPSATDACGGAVTVMRDPAVGFEFPVGTTVVTWFAIDRFGNVATRTQNVTVNVATAPTLTQPANKTFSTCAVSSIGTATAADACGVPLTPTNDAPAVFPVGTTTVTWKAIDNANRTVTKTQTVTISLSSPPKPTLTPPPDLTVNSCQVPQLGTATGTDACGAPVTITNNAPAKFGVGTTTVTWTAKDKKNQTTTASQLVTISVPSAQPALTIPPPVTITNCTSPTLGSASAVDVCGAPLTVTKVRPSRFPLGTSTVAWTATDGAGNSITKLQTVSAELGDSSTCCPAGTNVIMGTSSANVLVGTSGSDCMLGLGGDDVIVSYGGNDYISGGAGSDNIDGGDGNDRIWSGVGQDVVYGGAGDDLLFSGADADNVSGGAGNDRLECGDGADNCNGEDGDDIVLGGNGDDLMSGGNGDDQLFGEAGNDRLTGSAGIDALDGGEGTDTCTVDPPDTRLACELQ